MKTRILIIEDDYRRFFSAKQVLQSQLRIKIKAGSAHHVAELAETTTKFSPDVIILCPTGGILDLLKKMKKRKANCRNTEITLILAEFPAERASDESSSVEKFVNAYRKMPEYFAEAMAS